VVCARIEEPARVTAALLGRSTDAVHHRRATLRRTGGWVGRFHLPWSPEEDRVLLDHPEVPARELATWLGRTRVAVNGRRATLRQAGRG
jgi:hypothetical protein